jgi:proteasome accessory factor C
MLEYFPMRVVAELPDGHREVAMTYAAEDWLVRQILGFGSDVAVLGPPSVVERVRRSADEALTAYTALES